MTGQNGPRKLSAVVVSTDGPNSLCQTLDTVQSLADEIVLVNGSPSDAAGQLARQRSTVFVEAAADLADDALRNHGIRAASGDWILLLESGDRIPSADADRLRQHIDSEPMRSSVYMMLVRSLPRNGENGAEQMGQLRLWPTGTALEFTGGVRPALGPASELERLGIEPLAVTIETGDPPQSGADQLRRTHRRLKLAMNQMALEGITAPLLNCQAESCQALQQFDVSAQLYREAVTASEGGSRDLLEAYYGLISSLDARGDDRGVVLNVCLEALEHFPLDLQLLCATGGYLQTLGRLDLAARSYQVAAEYGQINPEVWHLDQAHDVVTQCHSTAQRLLAG